MKTNHEIILLKTFLWLLIDSVIKFRYPTRKLPGSMGSALLQIEPMSPALAGRLPSTVPPGTSFPPLSRGMLQILTFMILIMLTSLFCPGI